jgi:sulfide:quinone oxidoreductase
MERFRVVIAGGGVAGLEGLLALREHAGDRIDITLLAPDEEFHLRPLSVTEPFERTRARSFPLREIARQHDAHFRHAALEAVDPERRVAVTGTGDELEYDALLLAIGVRGVEALPGAFTFHGSEDRAGLAELVADAERGRVANIAFAMPRDAAWPLPLYELALMTAARVKEEGSKAQVHLVSAEARPLEMFGARGSAAVQQLLEEAAVAIHLGPAPVRFEAPELELSDGEVLTCDCVVALPAPEAPEIPGIPQRGNRRLVPTDAFGRVDGREGVFAAGDVTAFPVKQGGLAAQQADSAATSIAALAGEAVDPQPFRPVLRGALLTGHGPRYLRAESSGVDHGDESEVARSVLWWPPAKIAGRLLAPYLAEKAGYSKAARKQLTDLHAPIGDDAGSLAQGHEDVVGLALESADANARWHDFHGALRWLEVAEDLELYLPATYDAKRLAWTELAKHGR